VAKEIIADEDLRTGSPKSGRLYEVDLLRAAAAVAVMLFHYTFSAPQLHLSDLQFPTLSQLTRYGYLGVNLFFIISGFVVLLTAWNRRPHEFVISRIVRLYPAYWFAVTATAVVLVLGGLVSDRFHVSALQYLVNLTMLQAAPNVLHVDPVYWTLWTELRFYLVIFVLVCFGITRRRVVGVLYAWLAATALLELQPLPHTLQRIADSFVLTAYASYFIAGMAICLVYRHGLSWTTTGIIALASCHAVYRGVLSAKGNSTLLHAETDSVVVVCVILVELSVVGLVALGATRRLVRPWFTTAGTVTYPLYLIHNCIGLVVFHVLGGSVNRFLLLAGTVLAMIATARVIHTQVELRSAPVLKWVLTRVVRSTHPAVAATSGSHVRRKERL
jgi:peptidoglycan/LPS O-acetylase OafA/YrhL